MAKRHPKQGKTCCFIESQQYQILDHKQAQILQIVTLSLFSLPYNSKSAPTLFQMVNTPDILRVVTLSDADLGLQEIFEIVC